MEKKRLKMSNRKFRAILIPILSVVVLLAIVANAACNLLASTLDTYVGKGETYISTPGSAKGLDGNYCSVLHADSAGSTEAAYAVARRVAEEGSILLKNNGVLPLAQGDAVMPFGYAYLHPIYGQLTSGGSAKWVVDPVTPEQGLSAFSIDTAAADKMIAAGDPEVIVEAAGTAAAGEAGSMLGGDCKIYEYDPSIYDGLSPAADTTGIVFVTRSGQEGQDQKFDAYEDGTPHYLALTENEKGAIRAAKETCGQVVVVLVASAPMELGVLMDGELEADAILWVGHPGERGFATLSDLLSGAVNPSGRTVDIYPADFTADPTYQNIGVHTYSNLDVTKPGFTPGSEETYARMYTEYQEGVYMGYRYYESADFMDDGFVYGELDGQGGFATPGAVCYPFGYGLSYTTYEQELVSVTQRDAQVTAQVKITNTGSAAGREVVQLYYTAPYDEGGNLAERTMRAATAVMPAQNCVGTTVGHANYALLTGVLRQEWGFQGMVVSDYWVWADNPLRDLCLRTGCDTYLCMFMPMMWNLVDYDSPTAQSVMRTAIHNICYTVANSNTMQGMAPGAVIKSAMSPWMKALIAADVLVALLAAGGVAWIVLRAKQEKEHPELFKGKRKVS